MQKQFGTLELRRDLLQYIFILLRRPNSILPQYADQQGKEVNSPGRLSSCHATRHKDVADKATTPTLRLAY
jgi:hypothetical protein